MAMTDAQKRAQERYRRAWTTQVNFKLHRELDADILERLEEEPSKIGYLKKLVRDDIARRARERGEADEGPAREQDEPANEATPANE